MDISYFRLIVLDALLKVNILSEFSIMKQSTNKATNHVVLDQVFGKAK